MTRLIALELFGFKSFADRTRFEFPAGITVVVGPNGSGKSNVVDAIKWVLGEQSVRSLRGKEMTDVIFAGSTSRKPLNMAEVSLVFDNSARELPVAGDEVQISRRVYRNGDAEYLVNGETARLRDIRELFSGTGAATEAYSVIEQGRVDALLVASGRDRRVVFEEAPGSRGSAPAAPRRSAGSSGPSRTASGSPTSWARSRAGSRPCGTRPPGPAAGGRCRTGCDGSGSPRPGTTSPASTRRSPPSRRCSPTRSPPARPTTPGPRC
jgi:energy-coupling factor transporter ATP-binding protein EcfA2